MGYISVNITNIDIPNSFKVYVKPDGGHSKPYPILGDTWVDYGVLVGVPIYPAGTTEIWMSGSTYDFQYGTTYWVKLVEFDYPERYVIRNIRIFDAAAFGITPFVSPTRTPSNTITPSVSRTPSITRSTTISITPTRSLSASPPAVPSISRTPSISITPSISLSSSKDAMPSQSNSRTPSISLSNTRTPSITPTNAISLVRFDSISNDIATMGVQHPNGRIFTITFDYTTKAYCDNNWSMGSDPVNSSTYLYYSINGGSTWNQVVNAYAEANVSGGTYPIDKSDSQEVTGSFTLTGITNVNQVKIRAAYDCAWGSQNAQNGSAEVIIHSVSVNIGDAAIVCDNRYYSECPNVPIIDCLGVPLSPSPTPTITPSISQSVTPTPEVIKILMINQSGGVETSILDVKVDGVSLFDVGPLDFPIWPGDRTTGRSRLATGMHDVSVHIQGYSSGRKRLTFTDSLGTEYCEYLNLGESQVIFRNIYLNQAGTYNPFDGGNISGYIIFYSGGDCPPPPSPSNSKTPSITRSPRPSGTPGRSETPTPTSSPTKFAYNVLIYACDQNYTCRRPAVGSAGIVNSTPLIVGYYYNYTDYIFYISSESSSFNGDVVNINSTGFSDCNNACVG